VLRRWRHKRRCAAVAAQCAGTALGRCLEQSARLDIDHLGNTPIIAADLELTGLDAAANRIISIGWVLVDNGRVQLGASRHVLVATQQSVGSSAAIHELMDNEVAEGITIEEGLEQLFEAASGRLWVFHHAGLDVAFLRKACEVWAGVAPPFAVLDTLQIELGLRKRREVPVQQGDLQLGRLRSVYNLPRYTAHNAMTDAIATAELLMAVAARLNPAGEFKLGPYLRFF
jgi:DNA polymerase III subunit epsilon